MPCALGGAQVTIDMLFGLVSDRQLAVTHTVRTAASQHLTQPWHQPSLEGIVEIPRIASFDGDHHARLARPTIPSAVDLNVVIHGSD